MRFACAAVALLSASLASAISIDIEKRDQSVIAGDDLKIPGDSPLQLCPKSHGDDLVEIKRVDLSPNPPEA